MVRTASTLDRRALSRALSQVVNGNVMEVLHSTQHPDISGARRIGVTGPPGVGKSSLIGRLIEYRLERARQLAVVAIDPSSPNSHGSVLGDRLRMDAMFDHPGLYIRSLSSRGAHDGLTDNVLEVLDTLDRFGFEETIVETVGVGQAQYGIRAIVDTEVLVLGPDAGDHVQAMKCGVLETADVCVVNKADLVGAERVAAEVRNVLNASSVNADSGRVLVSSQGDEESIAAIDRSIQAHLDETFDNRDDLAIRRLRCRLRIQNLIQRQVETLLTATDVEEFDRPLVEVYRGILDGLAGTRP